MWVPLVIFGLAIAGLATGAVLASPSLPGALFPLIGLGIAAAAGWQLLATVGPRPYVWADRTEVEGGETFKVRWETSSRFKEASSVRITWEGCEVAIERGYNSTWHRSAFVTRVLTSEIGPLAGTAPIVMPAMPMPSFAARNAQIEWRILAEVKTRRWPSVTETYVITVVPGRVEPDD